MNEKPVNFKALSSLILGILGLTLLPLLGSIAAVILAGMAETELAADPTQGGINLAKAGKITGWVGTAISLCTCVLFAASVLFALAETAFTASVLFV